MARQPAPGAVASVASISAEALLLRGLLIPRLNSLSSRLELAGHSTVIDERLTVMPPSVRFRLTPRRGTFEDPDQALPASVLEVLVDGAGPTVSGRFWLDPLAESPTTQVTAPTDQVDLAWIDRLLISFVEKGLRVS